MAHMSVPCHEGPPATKGHFSSEPAVAGRGRYYCIQKSGKASIHVWGRDMGNNGRPRKEPEVNEDEVDVWSHEER